jgi:tetratricopeptide (TPR) repeat protein
MQLAGLLLVALAGPLGAAGAFDSSALSVPFENAASSARAAALGGAAYFADGDADLALQNPAQLSSVALPQAGLHHNSWIADILQEIVTLGLPLGRPGSALGATVNYVNYGRFTGRDETGRVTGALGASDLGLGLAYGRRLFGGLSAGLGIKALQQTLAEQSYQSASGDLGLLLSRRHWSASAALANLGGGIGGNPRSSQLRLGMAGLLELGGEASFMAGLGADLRPSGAQSLNLGLEIGVSRSFFMRCGYKLPLQSIELSGLDKVSAGLGFKAGRIRVDYAYIPFGELGNVNRLSLGYAFGAEELPAPAPPSEPPRAAPPLPPVPPQSPPQAPQNAPVPLKASRPEAAPEEAFEFVLKVTDKDLKEARLLAKQGHPIQAAAAYGKAIQRSPEDALAWRELADLYVALGKRDFALRCYEEAIRLQPTDAALKELTEKMRQKIE